MLYFISIHIVARRTDRLQFFSIKVALLANHGKLRNQRQASLCLDSFQLIKHEIGDDRAQVLIHLHIFLIYLLINVIVIVDKQLLVGEIIDV